MPTPRSRGGAPLAHVPINLPGFRGLNKQAEAGLLDPSWATKLNNTTLDSAGRLSARKGFNNLTTGFTAGEDFLSIHCDTTNDVLYASSENYLWRSADGGDNWTNVTGATTMGAGGGQFLDFNNTVVYVNEGQKPAVWGGSTFANIADANAPTGGVGLAAFGRLWITTSTGKSFKYCAILDETDWTSADTGLIDTTSIAAIEDTITALASHNGTLWVFGKYQIIAFDDQTGSVLGVDPLQMAVTDYIPGSGCIARDTLAAIKGDLWFLSNTGLMSLGRLVQGRSNPVVNLSLYVQDYLSSLHSRNADKTELCGIYVPTESIYLLSIPYTSGTTEQGRALAFDTRSVMEDGAARVVGVWDWLVPTCVCTNSVGTLIFSQRTITGKVGEYAGYLDNNSQYTMDYESGWSDMGDPHTKILKRITTNFLLESAVTVTLKWSFDFTNQFSYRQLAFTGSATPAYWGVGEWGTSEWNGGRITEERNFSPGGSGEYIKIGFAAQVSGSNLTLQNMSTYSKIGRLK